MDEKVVKLTVQGTLTDLNQFFAAAKASGVVILKQGAFIDPNRSAATGKKK